MLVIRLTRKGKKNQPFFKIIVIDKRRSAKGGRAIEELGHLNPLTKKYSINRERILYWLGVGAKASPRVHNLLVAEKVIEGKKVAVFNLTKKKKAELLISKKAEAPVAKAPSADAPVNASVTEAPTQAPAEAEKPAENLPAKTAK